MLEGTIQPIDFRSADIPVRSNLRLKSSLEQAWAVRRSNAANDRNVRAPVVLPRCASLPY